MRGDQVLRVSECGSDMWSTYRSVRIPHKAQRSRAWRHIARYLERYLPPHPRRVLDLAAGYSDFVNNVSAEERVAMEANADLRHFVAKGVRFEHGDCTDLSRFEAGSFNVVFASNFLEHLDRVDCTRLLREVRRVLSDDGRLILLQPNFRLRPKEYFDDYTHVAIFTDRSLPDFLRSQHFRIIDVQRRFLPLTLRSRGSALTFLVPLYLSSPWKPMAGQMLVVATKNGIDVA